MSGEFEEIEDEEVGEEEAEGELTPCPICNPNNQKSCRYCDGFGDVHPDDVDAILTAFDQDKRKQNVFVGVGAVLLAITAVGLFFLIQSISQQTDAEAGSEGASSGTSGSGSGTSGSGVSRRPKVTMPEGYSKRVKQIFVEMRLLLKVGAYEDVIKLGKKTLPMAKEKVQRDNIQYMIDKAEKKLGKRPPDASKK